MRSLKDFNSQKAFKYFNDGFVKNVTCGLANQWLETSHNSRRSSICEHSAPQRHLEWTAYCLCGHEWRQWLHLCSKVQLCFWVSLCVSVFIHVTCMRVNTVYGWITACMSCDHTVMLALLLILILSLGQDCNHISGLIFVEKHVTDDNLPSVLSKTSQPRYGINHQRKKYFLLVPRIWL